MIRESEFRKMYFASHGIREPEESVTRVPEGWSRTNVDIRMQLRDIMLEKTDSYREQQKVKMSDYNIIDLCCRIPPDTMKKSLNGRYKITRNFLAKFAVGLQLEIDQANDLFRQHSGSLELTNDFDFIVYHALLSKDGIDDFTEEVYQYLGISLDKDRI